MSKKHIDNYYAQVCEDYKEALKEIKEFEKECSEGLVEPERVEKLKETLQPLLNNKEQMDYIMFLYNMPDKKDKVEKYKSVKKKVLARIKKENTTDFKLSQNKEVLKNLKELRGK